jgi:alanine racemase
VISFGVESFRRPPGTSAVLEIDQAAIIANWRDLSARHAGGAVAAVVKADAYGLGAALVAPALFAAGCRHFFTAHLGEALALRPLIPGAMLAVLGGLGPAPGADVIEAFVHHDLVPVLGTFAEITTFAAAAGRLGRRLPAILHIDTGMARLGLDDAELDRLAQAPEPLQNLDLRFVMTHLVAAETAEDPLNAAQRQRFAQACARLPPVKRSLANSSGIFLGPAFASDLARAGAALYGINPTPHAANPMRLACRLLARVLQVRDVPAGAPVGYNATWRAARPSRIATLGIGYADGWPFRLAGRGSAFFDGAPVPLVGRVSMDLTTYDITDHPGIGPGIWLELIGQAMPPERVAALLDTSPYEILTGLGARIARVVPPAAAL